MLAESGNTNRKRFISSHIYIYIYINRKFDSRPDVQCFGLCFGHTSCHIRKGQAYTKDWLEANCKMFKVSEDTLPNCVAEFARFTNRCGAVVRSGGRTLLVGSHSFTVAF